MNKNRRLNTQDLSWFMDLYQSSQLDLNPPYQRKSIWSPRERRFFLDTIFRGFPSPTIFLHKITLEDGRTKYAVVDGKQRLETVIRFVEDKIAIDKNFGDTRLSGKKWSQVKQDPELRQALTDYAVPVELIHVDPSLEYVNEVFDRINRYSRKLAPQELRHAKYDGWMITYLEKESQEPAWEKLHVVTTARTKRMADIQFLSELLIVVLKGKVGGFDQDEIDAFYADLENPSESEMAGNFDEQEVVQKMSTTRDFILAIEEANGAVSSFARNLKDFYSLWAALALNPSLLKSKPAPIAAKYVSFMTEVRRISEMEKVNESKVDKDALVYVRNNIGASTEPPQRFARHESLVAALRSK